MYRKRLKSPCCFLFFFFFFSGELPAYRKISVIIIIQYSILLTNNIPHLYLSLFHPIIVVHIIGQIPVSVLEMFQEVYDGKCGSIPVCLHPRPHELQGIFFQQPKCVMHLHIFGSKERSINPYFPYKLFFTRGVSYPVTGKSVEVLEFRAFRRCG